MSLLLRRSISLIHERGVALFDYDNDGYQDIYFVNSSTVDLVRSNQKSKSALYHNNGDGTFTDVTDKAGVGDIGWGMGVAVGDYNNDGFDDLYVTCLGENISLRITAKGPLPMSPGLLVWATPDGPRARPSWITITTVSWICSFPTT